MDKIIYTVAQGMDAMKFGNDLKYTQMGELHVGLTDSCDRKRYERLIRFFDETDMPYVAEVDMFAGVVKELAEKYGRYVPVNDFLYERAKEIEKEYVK